MPPINARIPFSVRFNDTTPAPPVGKFNIKWQHDDEDPANFSAYIDGVPGIGGDTNYVAKFTSSTSIGDSSIFDDGTIVRAAMNQPAATYLQVENDHAAGATVQAALVAQLGAGGTDNIFVGVTSSSFTTAGGIPASAGYLASGAGQTAGLYVQALAGDMHFFLGDGSSISMTLNGSSQLLPNAANTMDVGSQAVPWQTGWFGSNVVANGGFFMRISSVNRAAVTPSSNTLQFGDATASTWNTMKWFLSSSTPYMQLSSTQLLPGGTDNAIDLGSSGNRYANGWFGSNVISNGGFFIRVSTTNRGMATASGTTLQIGDATSSTWSAIAFYISSGTAIGLFNSSGLTLNSGDLIVASGHGMKDSGSNSSFVVTSTVAQIYANGGTQVAEFGTTAPKIYLNGALRTIQTFVDGSGRNVLYY